MNLTPSAFGSVYKAQTSTGEIVAVKVLATNSKQEKKEFFRGQLPMSFTITGHTTDRIILLHHRNLVNLVGYCAEKGQHMLVYVYMSKGSLASHLYSDVNEALCWDLRVHLALDAVSPVIHGDIKSSNILLDQSMRARVSDFGLSREEIVDKHAAIRGTFGYLDPDYISSGTFTKKSDVYSFGVLLFEIIAGRTPSRVLWNMLSLKVAALAYKCINRAPNKRPSMRDIVQVLTRILKSRQHGNHHKDSLSATDEVFIDADQLDTKIFATDHRRQESMDTAGEFGAL
ncbi:Calcium/calmodulin-regulated receptor-like kinase 1, partial [Mucuna pruriens]